MAQDSVLGPFIISLFINYPTLYVNPGPEIIYADDTSVAASAKYKTLQSYYISNMLKIKSAVSKWCCQNQLMPNHSKTENLFFYDNVGTTKFLGLQFKISIPYRTNF